MKWHVIVSLVATVVVLMTACASCSHRDAWSDGQSVSGSGVFTLIGSEPLARPAIRLKDNRVLLLDPSFRRNGAGLIGKKVRFSGTVSMRELISADAKKRSQECFLVIEGPDSIVED